jgi:hypothetical protein
VIIRTLSFAAGCSLLALSAAAVDVPSLDGEQLRAAGIVIARPVAAALPERLDALGVVLDPSTLVEDEGEVVAARAASHSAEAEVTRLRGLLDGGAGASRKALEAAEAEQAKASALYKSAASRLGQRWTPVAALTEGERDRLIDSITAKDGLLVRADLPGQHILGVAPQSALLAVDGVEIPGRVLGTVRQTSELQSAAVLIEVAHAPAGLGPGAHVAVSLLHAKRSGWMVPRTAVLYDDTGPYVYKQLARKASETKTSYQATRIKLLLASGDRWLVSGVEGDDDVVIQGAGGLWSMQGVGTVVEDDDD